MTCDQWFGADGCTAQVPATAAHWNIDDWNFLPGKDPTISSQQEKFPSAELMGRNTSQQFLKLIYNVKFIYNL